MPYNRNEQASLLNLLSALQSGMSGAQGLQIYNYLAGQNAARIAEKQAETRGLIDLLAGQAQNSQEFEGARALARAYQGGPLSPRIRQALRALYPKLEEEEIVEQLPLYQQAALDPNIEQVAERVGENIQSFLPDFLRGAPIENRYAPGEGWRGGETRQTGAGELGTAVVQGRGGVASGMLPGEDDPTGFSRFLRDYQRQLNYQAQHPGVAEQATWDVQDVLNEFPVEFDVDMRDLQAQRISPAAAPQVPSVEQQRLEQEVAQDAAEASMGDAYASIIAQLGLGEIQAKIGEESAAGNEVDPMMILAKWMSSPTFSQLDEETKIKVVPMLFQILQQMQAEQQEAVEKETGLYGVGNVGQVNPVSPWGS